MNERQIKAADIFIATADGRQALKDAGYSDDYAKKYKSFFEKEDVQAYIKEKIRPAVTDETEPDSPSEEIIDYLKRVMRGEEDTNSTQRMKAAEILCRHYGINKESKMDIDEEEIPRPIVICDDVRE